MKELQAEGITYIYLTPREQPSKVRSPDWHIDYYYPFMENHPEVYASVRAVLTRTVLPRVRGIYYLFWLNDPDLEALDQKVEQETYIDQDFRYSVKTIYQTTRCRTCGSWWHTLVIPPGDPYLGAPELYMAKIRMSTFLPCPNCGADMRQLVVKIFGQVSDEELLDRSVVKLDIPE